jgi:hypothetical protein
VTDEAALLEERHRPEALVDVRPCRPLARRARHGAMAPPLALFVAAWPREGERFVRPSAPRAGFQLAGRIQRVSKRHQCRDLEHRRWTRVTRGGAAVPHRAGSSPQHSPVRTARTMPAPGPSLHLGPRAHAHDGIGSCRRDRGPSPERFADARVNAATRGRASWERPRRTCASTLRLSKAESLLLPQAPPSISEARLSISSGDTSSTWVATLQRCPKGSSNCPARSP